MVEVNVRDNSDKEFEKAFRRWKKICKDEGFCQELRERQYYKKPSDRKREKERKRIYNAQKENNNV